MSVDRRMAGFVLSEVAGFATLAFLMLCFPYLQGAQGNPWAAERVVAYSLLFLGPFFIFLPLSLTLRLGPVWLLGAGSWALLGYVLLFVSPPARQNAGFFTYVVLLALLFVAFSSAFCVVAAAIGRRFLPSLSPFADMLRALRQGSLAALFVVSLFALSPLSALNWLNATLIFIIVTLTEFFFMARD